MSSSTASERWERVAAELRRQRDAQRAAWGKLEDITLGRYLAGEATTDERARVEAALTDHPELHTLMQAVRRVLGDLAGPDPNWPLVPGYQILGELGRGGMGVVYKAWMVNLKRVVALKMTLAGAHAGPAELARFRTEAEAMARLQHPNFAQIYGFGEHAGQPFIVMEFIDGGNLEEKLTRFMPAFSAREAALLAETLARAVDFMHSRGFVHRALRPADVLLTTEGVPKIIDFGLAKLVGREAPEEDPNPEGAIIGVPSYMAPEQARGQADKIGPLVDIYALGGILYELLTGLPPFRGETGLDTLQMVLSCAPTNIRLLQPKVPRDLEAICAKCLRKEPGERYPRAAALAEDLHRFLRGQPVRARPAGPVRRLRLWIGRQPATASLAAALVLVVAGALALVAIPSEEFEPRTDLASPRESGRLKAGHAVTLIGMTGPPAWYALLVSGTPVMVSTAPGDLFTLTTSYDFSLLELLPDPQQQRYRYSAEVRFNPSSPHFGAAGIFFAQSKRETAKGRVYSFCKLSLLHDLGSRSDNLVQFGIQAYLEPVRGQPSFNSHMVTLQRHLPRAKATEWRRLAVEVRPELIRVWWDGRFLGQVSSSALRKAAEQTFSLNATRFGQKLRANFTPRMGLGLYIQGGSASFRNVTVESLPERN
jgi:serine/threonine protein kinase